MGLIVSNSPRSARCAHPASLIYSSRSSATVPGRPKEWSNEYFIQRDTRRPTRIAGHRAGGGLYDAALLLVTAARVLGIPLHLRGAARRRRHLPLRIPA